MSNIPDDVKKPQDRKKTAAQAEADGDDTVTVEYGDKTYTMPASLEDADGDVLDAIDDQKISHALQGLLDEKQWAKFKATKPKVRDYNGLFAAFAASVGLGSTGE